MKHAQHLLPLAGVVLIGTSLAWLIIHPAPETPRPHSTAIEPASRNAVVVIDAGHGGQDSGALCAGVAEKDLTLDVARRVERLLQARGVATQLTRSDDSYISLADRAAITNALDDCVFVSIHFNDGPRKGATGVETYFASRQRIQLPALAAWLPFLQRANAAPNFASESLARFVQTAVVTRTKAIDRGTKAEQFFVIANVWHPAVLVEGGFMTNKDDVAKLANGEYREQLAGAIAEGVMNYRAVVAPEAGDPPQS